MSESAMVVHGVVARVIDVPSQGNTYLRIEVPIEFHAELTRLFYNKRVIVMPATDKMAGQPYGMIRLEATDDATPPRVAKPGIRPAERPPHPPGGSLSVSAATICTTPAFVEFSFAEQYGTDTEFDPEYGTGDATAWLKTTCGIRSRAELDHRQDAAGIFSRIMARFRAYCAALPEGMRP